MNPIDKIISWGIGLLIFALAVWWFSASVIASIRAPVVAELTKAQEANASLVTAKDKAEAETARLNNLLATRTDREAKADRKLERINNALDKLASSKPEVRAWTDAVIPDDVIGLRNTPENGSQGRTGQVRDSVKPDGTHKPAAAAGNRLDQRATIQQSEPVGDASEQVQQQAEGRGGLAKKMTILERINDLWK